MLHGWKSAFETVLELPTQPKPSVPASSTYGRLDRLGIPASVTNKLRRFLPQRATSVSGFDEWPGSLCADDQLTDAVGGELRQLELQSISRILALQRET
jgi:hypothetical protein